VGRGLVRFDDRLIPVRPTIQWCSFLAFLAEEQSSSGTHSKPYERCDGTHAPRHIVSCSCSCSCERSRRDRSRVEEGVGTRREGCARRWHRAHRHVGCKRAWCAGARGVACVWCVERARARGRARGVVAHAPGSHARCRPCRQCRGCRSRRSRPNRASNPPKGAAAPSPAGRGAWRHASRTGRAGETGRQRRWRGRHA
jgi:hypothetical protein